MSCSNERLMEHLPWPSVLPGPVLPDSPHIWITKISKVQASLAISMLPPGTIFLAALPFVPIVQSESGVPFWTSYVDGTGRHDPSIKTKDESHA